MPTSRVGVLVMIKKKKKKIEIDSMSRSKRMMGKGALHFLTSDREAEQLQIASGGLAWFQSCTGPIPLVPIPFTSDPVKVLMHMDHIYHPFHSIPFHSIQFTPMPFNSINSLVNSYGKRLKRRTRSCWKSSSSTPRLLLRVFCQGSPRRY